MNSKISKRGFKKEKYECQISMFIVASLAVMVIHCCIWFEQKGWGGIKHFETSVRTHVRAMNNSNKINYY